MSKKNRKNLVLIAEDNYDLCKIISLFLEKEGFFVLRAHNGKIAEILLKMYYDQIAFCLFDVSLPKKDGVSLLFDIKNNDNLKNIPVIMLSNLKDEKDIKKIMEIGARAHIKKQKTPIHEIIKRLKVVLASPGAKKINFDYDYGN
jgi:DNA-binding response OmpR family regulator